MSPSSASNRPLQEAELIRLLVKNIKDYAISMLSPEGIVISWNSGAQQFIGYEGNEIIGRNFSLFYREEDQNTGLPNTALSIASAAGKYDSQGWLVRKDGSCFWASVIINPIHDENGNLIGFAIVTRDITQHKKISEDPKKVESALFQAQKMESIGLLTGGIAHDFNNQLNIISNCMELLRRSLTNPKELHLLDGMDQALSKGALSIQQLLAFAKRQTFTLEQRNVNHIISSFETMLRRANSHLVRFDIRLADHLPAVEVDVDQFELALLNLVINACDATRSGGKILLSTEIVHLLECEVEKLPAGTYVKINVFDTGQGIPADIINRVVEPFFTTKPSKKGSGLGLSQVYGFARQANGGLQITSTEGLTVISIILPALEGEDQKMTLKSISETALIVDDEPDVLDIAAEIFRTLGYDVICAKSGREAFEIIENSNGINVLFSDVMMPGMNGIELAYKAKSIMPNIKVLLASGFTSQALKELYVGFEIFDLVSKPYKVSEVAKKLRSVSQGQAMSPA